jgi:hypothetical protein
MSVDPFPISNSSRSTFGTNAAIGAVGVLANPAKSAVMLSAGDITIRTINGPNLPFVGLAAGTTIPFVIAEIVAIGGGASVALIYG